jgi:hypothetical protein
MVNQHKRKPSKATGASVKTLHVLRTPLTAAASFPGGGTSASASFAELDEAAYIKNQEELGTKINQLTLQVVGHISLYLLYFWILSTPERLFLVEYC